MKMDHVMLDWRRLLLVGLWAGSALVLAALPVITQPVDYHDFADQRAWLGIAHGANVLSNLPFFIVGIAGVATWWRRRASAAARS